MVKKILGYSISIIGLAAIVSSYFNLETKFEILKKIPSNFLLIGGVVITIIGILMLLGANKRKRSDPDEEVPIYRGKEIVGYRKH